MRVVFETWVLEVELIPTASGSYGEGVDGLYKFKYFFVWYDQAPGIVRVQIEIQEAEAIGECIASVVPDVVFNAVSHRREVDRECSPAFFGEGFYTFTGLDDFIIGAYPEEVMVDICLLKSP